MQQKTKQITCCQVSKTRIHTVYAIFSSFSRTKRFQLAKVTGEWCMAPSRSYELAYRPPCSQLCPVWQQLPPREAVLVTAPTPFIQNTIDFPIKHGRSIVQNKKPVCLELLILYFGPLSSRKNEVFMAKLAISLRAFMGFSYESAVMRSHVLSRSLPQDGRHYRGPRNTRDLRKFWLSKRQSAYLIGQGWV